MKFDVFLRCDFGNKSEILKIKYLPRQNYVLNIVIKFDNSVRIGIQLRVNDLDLLCASLYTDFPAFVMAKVDLVPFSIVKEEKRYHFGLRLLMTEYIILHYIYIKYFSRLTCSHLIAHDHNIYI
ncbi:hypothetical protein PR048_022690 [Dryococelus australis]|uniref:Uncharacterized protein n=1 Tax=Dryococelus australis TaxID=614101 RepID=A0ABQ9GRY3_9NEOP|nr:hypothetical protein PR048_022690 [Dryococelus australis]